MGKNAVTLVGQETTKEHINVNRKVRGAMLSLSLSMLLSSLGTSIVNVALPTLAPAFGASFQEIQWVVIAYLLTITTLIVGVGKLGDVLGHKRLLLAGLCLFTFASVLSGVAPVLWVLIVARGLQGLGAAVMMALSLALVGGTVTKDKIGSAMGLLGTMSAIGTALGPTLGGVLIGSAGWQAIFIVTAVAGGLTLLLTYLYLPADLQKFKRIDPHVDFVGTFLLATTLTLYALAMTYGARNSGVLNLALAVSAIFGVVLFIFMQTKVKSPLINLNMFRDPMLSAGLATSALVSTVLMATLIVGPFYLSYSLGMSAGSVGLVMSVGPTIVALTGVPAGRLVDKVGPQSLILIGLAGIGIGSIILSLNSIAFKLPGFVAGIVVLTIGYALFQTANNTAVMKDVVPEKRGVISGMLNVSRNLGLITGASLMGAVFAFASGASDIAAATPEDVATGLHATFVTSLILILLAAAIAIFCRSISARGIPETTESQVA